LKSSCVPAEYDDDERDVDRVSQHNTRPARPRPIFWSQTGLVLRSTGLRPHHCW